MKPETLTALSDSIAHWKRMRDAKSQDERPNASSCALCQRFNKGDVGCSIPDEPCPVSQKTGHVGCIGSPYRAAGDAFYSDDHEAWQAAAQAEIDFLESLLPKETP